MKNLSKNRCPLKRTSIIALISALSIIGMSGCAHKDVKRADTDSNAPPNVTQEATTVCSTAQVTTTSTTAESTKAQTTADTLMPTKNTSIITTATMTTTEEPIPITEIEIQTKSEPVIEPETFDFETYAEPVYEIQSDYNESDAVLLAKLINHESSATWEGKVAVGSCVINRCNYFGESVSNVIFAPNQFTTASSLGYYTSDDYDAAVYVFTYGTIDARLFYFDGCHADMKNWFYDIDHNYIGAY